MDVAVSTSDLRAEGLLMDNKNMPLIITALYNTTQRTSRISADADGPCDAASHLIDHRAIAYTQQHATTIVSMLKTLCHVTVVARCSVYCADVHGEFTT